MWVNYCRTICPGILKLYVLCSVLLLGFSAANAGSADDALWHKANTFYLQKQYDSAAAYYEQLLRQHPDNALLHYNAGNASYRLNEIGKAILHYEKAAFLDPGNQLAKDNLLLAKARVQNPVPEAPPIFFVAWWNSLLHLFHSNTWGVLVLLIFIAILALVYFARVKKEQFAHSGRWLSLGIVSLLVCGCMTWFSYDAATESRRAVVLQPATSFTEGPRANSKILGTLPEGTVLEVYQAEGSFLNVKLPNGREGWIPSASAGKI
jgi:tetratricopeptide (TPR) repeat protein